MKAIISPEPALLGFLRAGPLHGYDLHKQVVTQLGPVWHLGMSQMYAILKEYAARGWIQTLVIPQNGRPPRKMLQLTPAGRRAFNAWMAQAARGLREFRVDFFARLYFAREAGRPALREFLDHQLDETRRERIALQHAKTNSDYAALVRDFRIAQLETILAWLEEYRAEKGATSSPPKLARKSQKKK